VNLTIFHFIALNENGENISKSFKDWPARIVQHEMDHLIGKLYTDSMDRRTLACTCWEEVNLSQGKIAIPFYPE
jgi:peptide deformylase